MVGFPIGAPSITQANPVEGVYLKGNESLDGSIRFILDSLSNVETIEVRADGVWNLGEFQLSQGSLKLGRDVSLSAAGHHLIVTAPSEPQRLMLEAEYDDDGTGPPEIPILGPKFIRSVQQPDNSGSLTTTSHLTSFAALNLVLTTKAYLQTGATAASEDVALVLSHGIIPNDIVFFQHNFPSSDFPANSEVIIDVTPGTEFDPGVVINAKITSNAAFTMKYNAAITVFWFALDFQQQGHEDILTETLMLDTDLCLLFSNDIELLRPNKDLVLI